MSFDGVFYIKKWCAEEERFFQFSKFLDQAILKVFIRVESFCFGLRTSFLWLLIRCRQSSVFPTYCLLQAGHVSKWRMFMLLQWNLL